MSKSIKNKGFTIVELLVVIVVIGILAAITIVSYGGVTAKANQAKADSAASDLMSKILIYRAETGNYPAAVSDLATPTTATYYYVNPSGITTAYTKAAAPCATTGFTAQATVVATATTAAFTSPVLKSSDCAN